MKLPESPYAFFRSLERFVREVDRLAIVRLKKQEPHRRGIHTLLAQIARRQKVSVPLRHLRPAHIEEFPVHPVTRERLTRRASLGARGIPQCARDEDVEAARKLSDGARSARAGRRCRSGTAAVFSDALSPTGRLHGRSARGCERRRTETRGVS